MSFCVFDNMASYDMYWIDDDRKSVPLVPSPKEDFVDLGEELKQFWTEWDCRYCCDGCDGSDDDSDYDGDSYYYYEECCEESFWDHNYCRNDSYCSTDFRLNSMESEDFSTDDGLSSDESDSDCSDRFYHDKTEKNYFYI